jgi:hypothetical protein
MLSKEIYIKFKELFYYQKSLILTGTTRRPSILKIKSRRQWTSQHFFLKYSPLLAFNRYPNINSNLILIFLWEVKCTSIYLSRPLNPVKVVCLLHVLHSKTFIRKKIVLWHPIEIHYMWHRNPVFSYLYVLKILQSKEPNITVDTLSKKI